MRLLSDEDLQVIKQIYEAQTVNALLGTKRADNQSREELYGTIQAVRDFFDFMQQIVRRKDALENPEKQDTTDDPRVHDIYSDEELIAND